MPTATKIAVRVTLAMFDKPMGGGEKFRVKRKAQKIERFTPLTFEDYSPNGGTPLRDATMAMISELDAVQKSDPSAVHMGLLLDESGSMERNKAAVIAGVNEFVSGMNAVDKIDPDAGGTVLCVIVTDGFENSSTEVTREVLHKATADREERGWTFIYLGANQDAWDEGRSQVGVSGGARGQTVSYESTPVGTTSAMASVTADAVDYLEDNKGYTRKRGQSANRSVSESGKETVRTDVPQPDAAPVEPYGDVKDALRRAKESTQQ